MLYKWMVMMIKRILSACMSSFSRGDGKTGFGGYILEKSIGARGSKSKRSCERKSENQQGGGES
jgi:hypothetical protein